MHFCFAFLETIGTGELLVIAFVALIVFGPRKLPELARKLGQSMGEFKRASDEFKRTWEHEVEMERLDAGPRASQDATVARVGLPAVSDVDPAMAASNAALMNGDAAQFATTGETQTIARNTSPDHHTNPAFVSGDATAASAHEMTGAEVVTPPGKEDWL